MLPRLAEVNYSPDEGLTLRFQARRYRILPDQTRGHLKAANKELLLAIRSFIDETIERIDRPEPKPRRRRRIQVQTGSGPAEETAPPEGN